VNLQSWRHSFNSVIFTAQENMKRLLLSLTNAFLIALAIAGFTLDTHAVTNPVVACATTTIYANVTDPIKLAFAPDGTLYVGRDNSGSGGSSSDAVKIHRVAAGGSPVTEFGDTAITDPDAVAVDVLGLVSGTPGAVLVGGTSGAGGARISKITPSGGVSTLFGGLLTNMNNPGELLFETRAGGFTSATSDRMGSLRPRRLPRQQICCHKSRRLRWRST
jgi:hypothetical protein